jgi:Fe-S cluster assembly protein SufD
MLCFTCVQEEYLKNNVLESVKIPQLKNRINKLIAKKLGVNIGFDL